LERRFRICFWWASSTCRPQNKLTCMNLEYLDSRWVLIITYFEVY
jgi:hypothetical protein